MAYINEEIKAMEDKRIARTDGKTGEHISLGKKGIDANWAGTKNAGKCILLLVEGNSAKELIIEGVSTLDNGSNIYGALALKGKPINVTNHSVKDVNENQEIALIKKMVGLKHGVDYSKDEEVVKLRYGKVKFMCDADVDGYHIQGLLLNYYFREFPELVKRGFVCSMSTPAVRIKIPNNPLTFYSHKNIEYQKEAS